MEKEDWEATGCGIAVAGFMAWVVAVVLVIHHHPREVDVYVLVVIGSLLLIGGLASWLLGRFRR